MFSKRAARNFCSLAVLTLNSSSTSAFVPRALLGGRLIRAAAAARPSTFQFASGSLLGRNMSSATSSDVIDVAGNLREVENRVAAAAGDATVRLVAVSKTKPMELLEAAYAAGCRCFGENYVQELVEKMNSWKDRHDDGLSWHYIGALQSNKCNQLVAACHGDVTKLVVETIATTKLANKLNNAIVNSNTEKRMKVFVQVNTSGEESKSGIGPGQPAIDLCLHIAKECPALDLKGLMTIGAVGDLECFATLRKCREEVEAALPKSDCQRSLELSMGMSGDFEQAIAAGATNVRVGSTIFGARDYSK